MVLTDGSISQQGKGKPNLTIHLTLTWVESPGQHGEKSAARQNSKMPQTFSISTFGWRCRTTSINSFSVWNIIRGEIFPEWVEPGDDDKWQHKMRCAKQSIHLYIMLLYVDSIIISFYVQTGSVSFRLSACLAWHCDWPGVHKCESMQGLKVSPKLYIFILHSTTCLTFRVPCPQAWAWVCPFRVRLLVLV